MLEKTLGKERDDPELVRFVAQSTGKRSHVSENVRVRSTPCVASGLSFNFLPVSSEATTSTTNRVRTNRDSFTQKRRGQTTAITVTPHRPVGAPYASATWPGE